MTKLSSLSSLSYLCAAVVVSSSFCLAQSPEAPALPKSPEAVEGQAKSLVKSTGSSDEKRALMKKRIAQINAKQAEFMRKLSEGKVQTFPDVRAKMPEILRQIDGMKFAYQGIINASTSGEDLLPREAAKIEEVKRSIYQTMQKIGPFLAHADTRASDLSMTPAALATLIALQKEDHGTGAADLPELDLVTEEHAYTLHFIPAPIRVKSTPNTAVYFDAVAGGKFKALNENTTGDGLSMAKVITDKDGYADIAWYSKGDSVGYNEVVISTPKASNFKIVSIETQKLLPQPLADLLALKNRVPKSAPTKEPKIELPKIK